VGHLRLNQEGNKREMTGHIVACPTCLSANAPARVRCTDIWHGEKTKPEIPSWLLDLLRFAEGQGADEVLQAVPKHIRREAGLTLTAARA
jgi:hypothetical protein